MFCFIGECVYFICNVLWVNVGVGYAMLVMFLKSMCPRVLSYISYELWFMKTYNSEHFHRGSGPPINKLVDWL